MTELEKEAEAKIREDKSITDKEAAIQAAKAAIGKEDLLDAIESGVIKASDVVNELPTEDAKPASETGDMVGGIKSLPENLKKVIEKSRRSETRNVQSQKN